MRLYSRRRFLQLVVLVLVFAGTTLTARLFGAGWGTASGFGQIVFAAALVALLLGADRDYDE